MGCYGCELWGPSVLSRGASIGAAVAIGAGSEYYDHTYYTLTIDTFAKVNYMTRRLGVGWGKLTGAYIYFSFNRIRNLSVYATHTFCIPVAWYCDPKVQSSVSVDETRSSINLGFRENV